MNFDRECTFDFLRALSCVFIVILHVSAMYVDDSFSRVVMHEDYLIASIWRVITDMGVPCFVMLSGAFLITDKNVDFNLFYKKSLKKIVCVTLGFSIIYVLFHYAENMLASLMGIVLESGKIDYIKPLINWLKGQPHVTMWYMYMIIPMYIIVPVLVMIKRDMSKKKYRVFALVMLVYSMVVSNTCDLSWILQFVEFLGYFLMGNVIREWGQEIKEKRIKVKNVYGGMCILFAFFLMILYWYLYVYRIGELNAIGTNLILVIANMLIFTGFSVLSIRKNNVLIEIVAEYSLWIYLIHPMFTELLSQVCGRVIKVFPSAIGIPIYAIIITVMCIAVWKICERFWQVYRKRKIVTNKVYH